MEEHDSICALAKPRNYGKCNEVKGEKREREN
jgi:hypothetical protein